MRDAEIEALAAVAAAYERWTEASTRLEEQMSAAAAQEAAPPVDALRNEFSTQLAVTGR